MTLKGAEGYVSTTKYFSSVRLTRWLGGFGLVAHHRHLRQHESLSRQIFLRSQYKATGLASRAQRSRYPKGTSSLIPKPLTFAETPCSPSPHHQVPLPATCSPSQPDIPLWWLSRVKGAPEWVTWSPQYVTAGPGSPKPVWYPVGVWGWGGHNDAEGAEAHPRGRFHFLCI